jgi:hypothetical protein
MQRTAIVVVFFVQIFVLAIYSRTVHAQDTYKYEFFGGFTYADLQASQIGWNAVAVRSISRNFGIVVDISRANTLEINPVFLSTNLRINRQRYLYMAGFQAARRDSGKWIPYGQLLAGVDHSFYAYDLKNEFESMSLGSSSINALALSFGGGFDYVIKGPLVFRLFQANFIVTHPAGKWIQGAKIACGLVLGRGKTRY